MDTRKGFDRLSKAILVFIWLIFIAVSVTAGDPVRFGENLVVMLICTVAYMVFCKGVAWVYNGFTSK